MTVDGEFIQNMMEKVSKYRDNLSKNEEQVRYYIINPLLRKLNWDPEDPDLVIPENKTSEGYPDYTLVDPSQNNKKIIIIEAKKLSTGLEQHISQLGKYCYNEGTKFGLLTNGTVFVLMKSFVEGVHPSERVIWKLDLENDSIQNAARMLNMLDRNNIGKLEEMVSKINNLYKAWDLLIEDTDTLADAILPKLNESATKESSYNYEESELISFIKEKLEELIHPDEENEVESSTSNTNHLQNVSERYSRMYIGNERFDINTANQILINTAEWLIKKGKINEKNIPIPAGPKRYLINRENKNKYGGPLPGGKRLSNGYWIMLNLSKDNCVIQARRLLKKFEFDPTLLRLE